MSEQAEEQISLKEQFEAVIQTQDKLQIKAFLDHQNISDVAELVYEYEEYEGQIIANMSVHRAASVFKILEFPTQKRIIKELPSNSIASLLNELPADDLTAGACPLKKGRDASARGCPKEETTRRVRRPVHHDS